MPDPEMISRAHRAALTLERAWERWRIMHGLSDQPMPPVSSYVGYSIEEPWGRPRVVFGLDAREAEMMAALLDRHECVGPFYQADLASEHPHQLDPLPEHPYQSGPVPEHRPAVAVSGQATDGEEAAGLALARIPAQAPSWEPGEPAGDVRAAASGGDAPPGPEDAVVEPGQEQTAAAAGGPADMAGMARAGQGDPVVAPVAGQGDRPDVAGRQDGSADPDPGEPGAAESQGPGAESQGRGAAENQGPGDGPHEQHVTEPERRRSGRSRHDGPHSGRGSRSPAASAQEPAPDGLRYDGPGAALQSAGTGGEAAGDDAHARSTPSREGAEPGTPGGSALAGEHSAPGASAPGASAPGARPAGTPTRGPGTGVQPGRVAGEQPGRATERLAAWAFAGGWPEAGPGPGSYGATRTIR